MKKILLVLISIFLIGYIGSAQSNDDIEQFDTDLEKVFPKWKLCESDLQFKIFNIFKGLNKRETELDIQNIIVCAAPLTPKDKGVFKLIFIKCGNEKITSSEINKFSDLKKILSGDQPYNNENRDKSDKGRDYCYMDMQPEYMVEVTKAKYQLNYFEPGNAYQSVSLSLFEQTLKIGNTDFWIKNYFGNDEAGLPFYSSGDARIVLKRPLFTNSDPNTNGFIKNKIYAYLGGSYRVDLGVDQNSNGLFQFLPTRNLNSVTDGKIVGGLDFYLPELTGMKDLILGFRAQFEVPITSDMEMASFNINSTSSYTLREDVDFSGNDSISNGGSVRGIAPFAQTFAQASAFAHWWLDNNGENYLRLDLGMSYLEVQEYVHFTRAAGSGTEFLTAKNNVEGLNFYHPTEFMDWLYFKAEYRSQSVYPFSMAMQISNQNLLVKGFIPLLGNWLFLEAKYNTPLRDARPYEISNFFMISPVLRLTL
jgi:hypothetical protein